MVGVGKHRQTPHLALVLKEDNQESVSECGRIPSWRWKVVMAKTVLQLHNRLDSLGHDDLVNWECHIWQVRSQAF